MVPDGTWWAFTLIVSVWDSAEHIETFSLASWLSLCKTFDWNNNLFFELYFWCGARTFKVGSWDKAEALSTSWLAFNLSKLSHWNSSSWWVVWCVELNLWCFASTFEVRSRNKTEAFSTSGLTFDLLLSKDVWETACHTVG